MASFLNSINMSNSNPMASQKASSSVITKTCNDGVFGDDVGNDANSGDDDTDGIGNAPATEEISVVADTAGSTVFSERFSSVVRERQKCHRGNKRL